MLTDVKKTKRRKLSLEVLGLLAACILMSVALYIFLFVFSLALVEQYCAVTEVVLSEAQRYATDSFVFSMSLTVSVAFFIIMFLVLLGERLAYIRKIIQGIHILQDGELTYRLPTEGNNELTQLAEAINELSVTRQEVREKEERLQAEREELIRTLSHDIRTPLTSILSYSQWLSSKETCTAEEQAAYLTLVTKKSEQIKELTDILLDGGKREPELFEDARLLMKQLAGEFEETLEDQFTVHVDLTGCPAFSGRFDVRELRRVFDNLASNVQKYADPRAPVALTISHDGKELTVRQQNAVIKGAARGEGHRLGLNSIRRILQSYQGTVSVSQDATSFEITLVLSKF